MRTPLVPRHSTALHTSCIPPVRPERPRGWPSPTAGSSAWSSESITLRSIRPGRSCTWRRRRSTRRHSSFGEHYCTADSACFFRERVPALDVLERVLREHQVDTLFLTDGPVPRHRRRFRRDPVGREATFGRGRSALRRPRPPGTVVSAGNVDHHRLWTDGNDDIRHLLSRPTRYCRRRHAAFRSECRSAIPSVYLLDTLGKLVPAGVPGELYIGGPGVARGYWNQPELTAQRFLPDPFDNDPARACTGRETSAAACRTEISSSWVGSTVR